MGGMFAQISFMGILMIVGIITGVIALIVSKKRKMTEQYKAFTLIGLIENSIPILIFLSV